MRLHDSPVTFRDVCHWPPTWVRLGRGNAEAKTVNGEFGILKEARYYPDRRGKIYLTIEHNRRVYVGCLSLEKHWFCTNAIEHLRRCYGMAVSQIGSSELL